MLKSFCECPLTFIKRTTVSLQNIYQTAKKILGTNTYPQ